MDQIVETKLTMTLKYWDQNGVFAKKEEGKLRKNLTTNINCNYILL